MLLNPFTYHCPENLNDALKLRQELPDAKILAGGTFLLNRLKVLKKKGLKTPTDIISLKKIPGLTGIVYKNDNLRIGAMTRINDLLISEDIPENLSLLKDVARTIATTPIRNMATIGGNLTCRYTWTELPAVLIALGAQMHFIQPDGKEATISCEDFFAKNAKKPHLLSHVTLTAAKTQRASYYRVNKSTSVDIPLLAVCLKTDIQKNKFSDTKICVNTTTAFPQRLHSAEKFLDSKASDDQKIKNELAAHISFEQLDPRADDYKKHMYKIALKNILKNIVP